jgi:hypothetical protein
MKPFHFTKPQPQPQPQPQKIIRELCVYNTMEDGTVKECTLHIEKLPERIIMYSGAGLMFEWTPERYVIHGIDIGIFSEFTLIRLADGSISQTGHPEWWNCDDLENEWSYEQAVWDFDNLSNHDYMMKHSILGRCYQG